MPPNTPKFYDHVLTELPFRQNSRSFIEESSLKIFLQLRSEFKAITPEILQLLAKEAVDSANYLDRYIKESIK